jgi:serine/threonine protein kinase
MCKLGDLGVARVMNSTVSKANTICGTPTHMAPEILNIQINKNGETYDKKCDIWSLGIILYQMCCLKTPFLGTSFLMMFKAIKKGVYEPLPSEYSPNMTHLINALLNQNPE